MSYFHNYLKSCFITLILALVYLFINKFFFDLNSFDEKSFVIIFSCIFIFIVGLVSPLTFFLAGKYTTTIKEDARPHLSSQKNTQSNVSKKNTNFPSATEINEEVITLYLGNIPFRMNENALKELLSQYGGNIYSIHLSRDPKTKKRKGIAFVKLSKEPALKAIEALNGTSLMGRNIVVKIANERANKEDA